ncbi:MULTISPECIES: XdhC family protein [unclassified Halanaerobium]|uniref:XdhC family protein n=1 Tax=unclassified Halanaerobium TaxID=2641197 RepID=UPI000E1858C0|nr:MULTISPECIES: XdhC family protein [unclassified Halanaerobium]RCW50682.1 XdhC/CoxI family protein [Halanaerobium sp. MA284_MarDTE_T2]RCW86850.1 XdhC/CoxI family protein [Halanaerobium sp. DL-01]
MRKSIVEKILEVKDDKNKIARAFVIDSKSSSPRNVGNEMLIFSDGKTFSTIGGGKDEKIIIDKALQLFSEDCRKSSKVEISLTRKEAAEIGWVCGGNVEIFIQLI